MVNLKQVPMSYKDGAERKSLIPYFFFPFLFLSLLHQFSWEQSLVYTLVLFNLAKASLLILWVLLRTELCPLPNPNSYAEVLTPNVTIFGDGAFKEAI